MYSSVRHTHTHTHTHTQAHSISNVQYQIRHHCVLTNTLLLCQVVSSFFQLKFQGQKTEQVVRGFPFIFIA